MLKTHKIKETPHSCQIKKSTKGIEEEEFSKQNFLQRGPIVDFSKLREKTTNTSLLNEE